MKCVQHLDIGAATGQTGLAIMKNAGRQALRQGNIHVVSTGPVKAERSVKIQGETMNKQSDTCSWSPRDTLGRDDSSELHCNAGGI